MLMTENQFNSLWDRSNSPVITPNELQTSLAEWELFAGTIVQPATRYDGHYLREMVMANGEVWIQCRYDGHAVLASDLHDRP